MHAPLGWLGFLCLLERSRWLVVCLVVEISTWCLHMVERSTCIRAEEKAEEGEDQDILFVGLWHMC